jgi:hypothetical protein
VQSFAGDVVDEFLKLHRTRAAPGLRRTGDFRRSERPHPSHPGTRFAPGSMFMGADLAKWLDEQLAKLGKPLSH